MEVDSASSFLQLQGRQQVGLYAPQWVLLELGVV